MRRLILAESFALWQVAAAPAASLDSSVLGAWTTSQADCKKLFEHHGGAITFRPPVDKFAQAAIIQPNQIEAPSGSCQIKSLSRENGGIRINAECRDAISYTPQSVRIKVTGPGQLTYSPSGDPALDTAMVRCAF